MGYLLKSPVQLQWPDQAPPVIQHQPKMSNQNVILIFMGLQSDIIAYKITLLRFLGK